MRPKKRNERTQMTRASTLHYYPLSGQFTDEGQIGLMIRVTGSRTGLMIQQVFGQSVVQFNLNGFAVAEETSSSLGDNSSVLLAASIAHNSIDRSRQIKDVASGLDRELNPWLAIARAPAIAGQGQLIRSMRHEGIFDFGKTLVGTAGRVFGCGGSKP